jgi:hypothetical protein
MSELTEEYRGFSIVVRPMLDHDDLWDFEYSIARPEVPHRAARSQTLGGHASADIAARAGVEVARIEIDNLLALSAS